MRHSQV